MQLSTLLTPSSHWLTQCQSHLQQSSHSVTDDAIFDQILFSDLRDVVPNNDDTPNVNEASKLLSLKIRESVTNGHSSIDDLTLMIQMEEIVDVSLNAEGMLADAPSNARTSDRMLKMVVSDGITSTIAMETSPISSLAVTSPPGTKLLLFGSIVIRRGILQLDGGNTLVLGGCVDEWVALAKEKKEREKRLKGMGVDATVKALIWCPEGEGDGESIDCVDC
jgi:hypothetical protein